MVSDYDEEIWLAVWISLHMLDKFSFENIVDFNLINAPFIFLNLHEDFTFVVKNQLFKIVTKAKLW
jgi:hypothetical protein